MVRSTLFAMVAALAISGSAASAAEPVVDPLGGTVHRLSPEEALAVQETAARRNIDAPSLDEQKVPDGRIHGEIGFGIGTGSYNSIFGTGIVPFGDDGILAFSFERTDFGRRRYRY
jgi:hypothetical protein